MTTLARYREAHSSSTGCLHDHPSCRCRECECRGIWSPDVHGDKCKDSCLWVNVLATVPGMEAVEDYGHTTVSTHPADSGPRAEGTKRLWWHEDGRCIYCGNDAPRLDEETGILHPPSYGIHENSAMLGPEYPLCGDCGSGASPTCEEIWEFIRRKKLLGRPRIEAAEPTKWRMAIAISGRPCAAAPDP